MVASARKAIIAVAIALALLAVAVYARGLRAPFIYDDRDSIITNPTVRDLSDIVQVIKSNPDSPVRARPAVNLTLAINYAIGELDPLGYHAVNLGMHVVCAWLIFGLLHRTLTLMAARGTYHGGILAPSAIIAALWTLHPLQTEAVQYVTQRTEVMASMFYVATLYAALRAWTQETGRKSWTAAAIVSCALAMLSKEIAVSLPIVTLLFDVVFVSGTYREAIKRHRVLYLSFVGCWGLLLIALLTAGHGTSAGIGMGISVTDYLFTQAFILCWYLRLCFWPWPLYIHYEWPLITDWLGAMPYGVIILALVAMTAWGIWRRRWYGVLGAMGFGVLAPSSSFIPIVTEVCAERRMYLPILAVILPVVMAVATAIRRVPSQNLRRAAAIGVVSITLLTLATLSAARVDLYRSDIDMWSQVLDRWPQSTGALINAGFVHEHSGDLINAEKYYRQAVASAPEYNVFVHRNLALLLIKAGREDEAIPLLEHAIEVRKGFIPARINLGDAYIRVGRYADAAVQLETALKREPDSPVAVMLLAVAYDQSGRGDEAMPLFQRAVELSPDSVTARIHYSTALAVRKRPGDALEQLRIADGIKPGLREVLFPMAKLLIQTGRAADGVAALKRIDASDDLEVDGLMGGALASLDRTKEALPFLERVALTKPDDAQAQQNYGLALAYERRFAEAVTVLERAVALDPGNADWPLVLARALSSEAWQLGADPATNPQAAARAVALAERSVTLTKRNNPMALDSLAVAMARAGRHKDALAIAEEAKKLAESKGNRGLAAAIAKRMKMYAIGVAYSEVVR